jgi:sugar phosphate isomerase/epimerase
MAGLKGRQPSLKAVAAFGLSVCQLSAGNNDEYLTDEVADAVREESQETGVRITGLWAGWPGPRVWDLMDGPTTLGLVTVAYRAIRLEALRKAALFAVRAQLPAVITHLGFIPENPADPTFREVVIAVRYLARFMEDLGLQFWFETGHETPVTMLRLIQAVGTPNLGINLDPANLILNGKGNPIDALDVFGPQVKNVHAKDALYPTDPMKAGREVKVGQGRVRFPEFVARLREIGFTGEYIIEREISGEQPDQDIRETIEYLQTLLSKE